MCGIMGWIDWERDLGRAQSVLESMARTLACRGPDAEGMWLSPHAALAHRRLIVVDPAAGGQPMSRVFDGHAYVVTYNGELYNTPELRRELEARGHTFRGHSDTEVLLVSFIEWGRDCLERLNGIFAFAIWSEVDQSLFLARDRLGVKPLFFTRRAGGFLFSSEIKALLAHPSVPSEVDEEGLAEVLVMGPGRTPGHGVFRGVEELKPGYWLSLDRERIRKGCYWRLESRPHPDDLETTIAKVRHLVQDAAERQLVADVPLCTLLSGGLDSSALTAFAAAAFAREGRETLRTFSVEYEGNAAYFRRNDFEPDADSRWAWRMAEFLGTRHREVVIDTDELVDSLRAAVWARDLPGMADVDASLYLFCREIKKEATVALSGECADEVFGGYPWFHREDSLAADTFPWTHRLEERVNLLSPDLINRLRPREFLADRYREALGEVPALPGEGPRERRIREISYLTLTRWMPVLLDRKDRMSMAVGLEVRVPFCDHRLVEYAWNIPWEIKSCDGMAKGVLRRALEGVLPEDVLRRRKSPYPKTHNPAYLEAVRHRLERILADTSSPLLPLLNLKTVRSLIRPGASEFDVPWFGQLMRRPQLFAYLVQVAAWLRDYRVTFR